MQAGQRSPSGLAVSQSSSAPRNARRQASCCRGTSATRLTKPPSIPASRDILLIGFLGCSYPFASFLEVLNPTDNPDVAVRVVTAPASHAARVDVVPSRHAERPRYTVHRFSTQRATVFLFQDLALQLRVLLLCSERDPSLG